LRKGACFNIPKFYLLLFLTAILVTVLLDIYCDLFSYLALLSKDRLIDNPDSIFFVTPFFFWLSALICRRYSIHASGNSMGHVKLAMQRAQDKPIDHSVILDTLNIRVVIAKFFSSLLCIFGGGALGREGPTIHMSTSIFAVVGNKFKNLSSKMSLEAWVFAGAAAGITIAFHAPITGLVFILEKSIILKARKFKNIIVWCREKLLKLESPHLRNSLVLSSIVVWVYVLMHNATPMFELSSFYFEMSWRPFLVGILTAILCGFLTVFFKAFNQYFYQRFLAIKSYKWHLVPILCGVIVALISYYCGIYSFSGGIYTAQEALNSTDILLSYREVIGRLLNTMVTFIAGCAGGLIAPAIAIGSGIGSILSGLDTSLATNVFILIGMTSFLGALLGNPITAAIMVFEITGQSVNVIPVLLITSFIAWYAHEYFRNQILLKYNFLVQAN